MYRFWWQCGGKRFENFYSNTLHFFEQKYFKKVKLLKIIFPLSFGSCPVSLKALNNHSGPTEGHLKQKPNFLLGESAGILIKMKGLKQEVG